MAMFSEIRELFVSGLWGDEEALQERDEEEEEETRFGTFWQGESVCDSSYACRGDSSVYQGESVCDMHRGASVFQGEESVCESSYAERVVRVVSGFGESVYEDESVCEPSVVGRRVANAPVQAAYSRPMKVQGPYQAREEDPVDVAIAEYFRLNPQAYSKNRGFIRIEPGHYLLHGREILIDFDKEDTMANLTGDKGYLVVRDGPLKQRLDDYLMNKGATEEYSGSVFKARNALQTIPKDSRMTFCDTGAGYSRIEAMKVAKEQAATREQAAVMTNQGQHTGNLVDRYEKTMDKKLGKPCNTTKVNSSFQRITSNTAIPAQRITMQYVQGPRSISTRPYLAGGA